MSRTYSYNGMDDLSPGEVFFWVAVDKTLDQFGVKDFVAAAMVLSGQPIITTRAKFGGATPGTSPASLAGRRLLNYEMRVRLPTITGASFRTLKLTFTRNLGAFVGRTVPIVGWLMLAYDAEEIIRHTVSTYNGVVAAEDRIGL